MRSQNRAMLEGALVVTRETDADAILLAAALPEEVAYLERALGGRARVITAAVNGQGRTLGERDVLALPEVKLRRRGRAKIALLEGLAAGLLHQDERVVVVSGNDLDGDCELDTVAVVELRTDEDYLEGQEGASLEALAKVSDPAVFDALLGLCVELGHVGREGKPVGLLATLGDHEAVLARSHPLVLNPFEGHPEDKRCILNAEARRAVAEFSGVDGAFVLRDDGVIVAAGRFLEDTAFAGAIPYGLGARHRAAAGITAATSAVALVVSESTGDTRVFAGGRIIMTIEGTD